MTDPIRLVTAAQMQAMDRATMTDFGLPGIVLMENAGRTAANVTRNEMPVAGLRIGILAGPGNNGGDGFVMGRYFLAAGATPTVFFAAQSEKLTEDAAFHRHLFIKAGGAVVTVAGNEAVARNKTRLRHQHLFIDALFGTGLNTPVQGHFAALIRIVNQTSLPVVSVDIPSGVHGDTGRILGTAIRATHTVTFGFAKPGHFLHPGRDHTGNLHAVDIGIPSVIKDAFAEKTWLLTPDWARYHLPERGSDTHKGSFGHVLIIGGAPGMTGAALLAARGAHRAGAGRITLCLPDTALSQAQGRLAETMTATLPGDAAGFTAKAAAALSSVLKEKTVVAAGPGMGRSRQSSAVLAELLTTDLPLVLDADALNLMADDPLLLDRLKNRKAETILTPHPGEMARLTRISTANIQQDRIQSARSFANAFQVHLVLKGAATVIAHPDGSAAINPTGNPAMATGGSGDVLAGIIAALLGQGCPAGIAAGTGTFLHGAAADLLCENQEPGILPSEVADALPRAVTRLRTKSHPPLFPMDLW